jgi:hypothetical protein
MRSRQSTNPRSAKPEADHFHVSYMAGLTGYILYGIKAVEVVGLFLV